MQVLIHVPSAICWSPVLCKKYGSRIMIFCWRIRRTCGVWHVTTQWSRKSTSITFASKYQPLPRASRLGNSTGLLLVSDIQSKKHKTKKVLISDTGRTNFHILLNEKRAFSPGMTYWSSTMSWQRWLVRPIVVYFEEIWKIEAVKHWATNSEI